MSAARVFLHTRWQRKSAGFPLAVKPSSTLTALVPACHFKARLHQEARPGSFTATFQGSALGTKWLPLAQVLAKMPHSSFLSMLLFLEEQEAFQKRGMA